MVKAFFCLAVILARVASAAEPPKAPEILAAVVTHDDCFEAYPESSPCQLSYCLGRISGASRSTGEQSYDACLREASQREIARQK